MSKLKRSYEHKIKKKNCLEIRRQETCELTLALRKITKFYLIPCFRNSVEAQSFHTMKLGKTTAY